MIIKVIYIFLYVKVILYKYSNIKIYNLLSFKNLY